MDSSNQGRRISTPLAISSRSIPSIMAINPICKRRICLIFPECLGRPNIGRVRSWISIMARIQKMDGRATKTRDRWAHWFVMSAIGLFEMDGGGSTRPIYEIGCPLFNKITIQLDPKYYPGGQFIIEAVDLSQTNRFIQSAELDENH